MSTITLPYFISILLSFPLILPSDGWVQWQFAFPNKTTCEAFLEQEHETIFVNVTRAFISMPHVINDFQCMTIKEGVEKNKALGHKTPQKLKIPKPKSPQVPRV